MFDRLFELDWETKEVMPMLAESWSYVEPTVLEVKLAAGSPSTTAAVQGERRESDVGVHDR